MKKNTIVFLTLIFTNFAYGAAWSNSASFMYHPFDTLMDVQAYPKIFLYTQHILHYDGRRFLQLTKDLYEKFNPAVLKPSAQLIIPKRIHQIWIGGPLPEVFREYISSWKEMHPDWEYTLWDNERVKELFPLYNQKYYDASEGMGVKSDLLKWEILYRFGGVYADVDFECLRPLDQLNYIYDFYTALQPFDAFFVQLGAALFAAHPGHPILKHCIETVKDDWHHQGAPKKTGPVHFSKSFIATAGQYGRKDIAFPAFYFYPQGSKERELKYNEWLNGGAYAIHHWAMSWMPKNYRRKKFQTFENERSSKVWND